MTLMVGFGGDNTGSVMGEQKGAGPIMIKENSPYGIANGCFAHLFQLTNKHSYSEFRHLVEFDEQQACWERCLKKNV